MNNIYAAENTVAREDLAALIARLSDAQLSQPMPAAQLLYARRGGQIELVEDPALPVPRMGAEALVQGDASIQVGRIEVLLAEQVVRILAAHWASSWRRTSAASVASRFETCQSGAEWL